MSVNEQTQAVLLLTAYFSKPSRDEPKPLSATEWGRFALWLKEKEFSPAALLTHDPSELLVGWSDKSVTIERVQDLLGRGSAMALALEKWQRAGLWVMTRSDSAYPASLKKKLSSTAPPLLFGCGNRKLLSKGGIAVVGSRNATKEETDFASHLGREAAMQGLTIVSGGARGIDEAAMLGALQNEGTVIGVLANDLLRFSTSAKYRKSLMNNDLVLISAAYPEAGFNVGNAMGRNKYIYCLSNAGVVVSSSYNSGGTWAGAIENLKHDWVPLWVKATHETERTTANTELVKKGARWLPENQSINFETLFGMEKEMSHTVTEASLFDISSSVGEANVTYLDSANESSGNKLPGIPVQDSPECHMEEVETIDRKMFKTSFFEFFLFYLKELSREAPITTGELVEKLDLKKSQIQEWLNLAVADGSVEKMSKPVRYQWRDQQSDQSTMFD
ncbi:MAG: DNA-processing protein DprA [Thermoleophilia bacterium]